MRGRRWLGGHLVDDVDREDTEGVVGLEGAGGTELLEGALGDPGEDAGHGVEAILGVLLHHARHLDKTV